MQRRLQVIFIFNIPGVIQELEFLEAGYSDGRSGRRPFYLKGRAIDNRQR
ncbi:MAG: hypothetical protein K9M07_02635 [Simkaniaceae bacterium]|nr:hypothetical protein [Simkaniaceae bacterium]MCF7852119.1 hypothetical protein [Simkaniaceae bacterium]